jgi:hypothetical protein
MITHRGTEFTGLARAMRDRKIHLVYKGVRWLVTATTETILTNVLTSQGRHKAGYAEARKTTCALPLSLQLSVLHFQAAISMVKERLYPYLRRVKEKNWVSALSDFVRAINNTQCISIGWLTPASIRTYLDEPRVRRAQQILARKMTPKERQRYFPQKDSFKDMVKRSGEFDKAPQPFALGDFVYLDKLAEAMTKGTEEKRGRIFVIIQILKEQRVVRYILADLAFKPVTGSVYR